MAARAVYNPKRSKKRDVTEVPAFWRSFPGFVVGFELPRNAIWRRALQCEFDPVFLYKWPS